MSESRTPGGTVTAAPGAGSASIAAPPEAERAAGSAAGPTAGPTAGGTVAGGQPPAGQPAGDAPGGAQPAAPGQGETPAVPPQGTAPVSVRPRVRAPGRGSLTRMGPWAPIAGLLLGLLVGVVVVLVLAGAVTGFAERLSLVLAVVGLGMLGAAVTLLADEIGMLRHAARQATVRPGAVAPVAALLTGLTPGRLLLLVSAFLLFVAAYVVR